MLTGTLPYQGEEAVTIALKALKEWAASHPQPDIDVVGCAHHRALEIELARRAVTLVRDEAGLFPLRLAADDRVAAVMPRPKDLTPADTSSTIAPHLAGALRAFHPRVDEFVTSHLPTEAEITALCEELSGYDLLILGTINASMQLEQAAMILRFCAGFHPSAGQKREARHGRQMGRGHR